MRTAKSAFVLLAIAALGCSQQPKAVFVDVDAILAADVPTAPEAVRLPNPPAVLGPQSLIQPPLPGQTLVDRARGQVAEARKILEQDRLQAQRNLERRLRTIYVSEIDAKGQDELVALKPEQE